MQLKLETESASVKLTTKDDKVDFKMAMISFTKKLPITYHKNINYDIGRYVGQ